MKTCKDTDSLKQENPKIHLQQSCATGDTGVLQVSTTEDWPLVIFDGDEVSKVLALCIFWQQSHIVKLEREREIHLSQWQVGNAFFFSTLR